MRLSGTTKVFGVCFEDIKKILRIIILCRFYFDVK